MNVVSFAHARLNWGEEGASVDGVDRSVVVWEGDAGYLGQAEPAWLGRMNPTLARKEPLRAEPV